MNRTFLSRSYFHHVSGQYIFFIILMLTCNKKEAKKKSFTRVPGHVQGGNTLKPPLWSVFNFEVILKHDFCFFSLFSYKKNLFWQDIRLFLCDSDFLLCCQHPERASEVGEPLHLGTFRTSWAQCHADMWGYLFISSAAPWNITHFINIHINEGRY